jgi:hypothetical protein
MNQDAGVGSGDTALGPRGFAGRQETRQRDTSEAQAADLQQVTA